MSIRQTARRATAWLALTPLVACAPLELGDRHGARVERYAPKPFTAPDAEYARPDNALGPPDGRTVAIGNGAHIIVRFFRPLRDGPGADLRVYEVGADGARARVAVSDDGERFGESPIEATGPTSTFDLADLGFPVIRFVRVRGLDDAGPEPGYDLDAVEALH